MSELVIGAGAPHGTQRTLFWQRLRLWLDVWAERRDLRTLDSAQLADIGLKPDDALLEAARPYWDVPRSRLEPLIR